VPSPPSAPSARSARLPRAILCAACALVLAALVPLHASAAPGASVYLEELTSPELRERIAQGATTALVPIGGTEQNGPQMVLGKHNVRVRALAGRIAQTLGDAIVAPVLAYVPEGSVTPPASHMRFAGTISIPEPAFEAVLEGTARSLRQHGFRQVVFLGDHGGYQASLQKVAARLNHEWAKSPGAQALALDAYYRVTQVEYAAALGRRGYGAAEIGTHAGLADTSLALAIDPALVRADVLAAGTGLDAAHGVYGNPRRATADLGQAGVTLVVEHSVAAIRAARGAATVAPASPSSDPPTKAPR